jgi:hypothetical protein
MSSGAVMACIQLTLIDFGEIGVKNTISGHVNLRCAAHIEYIAWSLVFSWPLNLKVHHWMPYITWVRSERMGEA